MRKTPTRPVTGPLASKSIRMRIIAALLAALGAAMPAVTGVMTAGAAGAAISQPADNRKPANATGEDENPNARATRAHLTLADYLDYETVSDPQISPDGETVLFTRRRIDKMNDTFVSTIWMMNRDGSRKRQLMEGAGAQWSPDGTRIAFVKADDNDQPQIFVRWMDGEGLLTQVTAMPYGPRSFEWSPDSRQIAFVARIDAAPEWTVSLPGKPKGANWTEDPPVIDSLHFRQDRVGLTNTGYDHLFVVPAEGGTPRQLTSGDWNVGRRALGVIAIAPPLSWSPDSKTIAFDGPGAPIDARQWHVSHINLVDVESGKQRTLTTGTGNYGEPKFSPDGTQIAYSGYPEHNTSYPIPRLYALNVTTGESKDVIGNLADGPEQLHWSPGGDEILFTLNKEGARNLHAVTLGGTLRDITAGAQVVSLSGLAADGAAALIMTDATTPPAVAIADTSGANRSASTDRPASALKPLTDVNADIMAGKTLGRVEEIWYDATAESGEKARVQGWLVYPPDYDKAKTYPLLLSIHGGPHAMYNTAFNFTFQEFAAEGYVVLYVNPRGSTGYGDAFVNAIRHRYPGKLDYADLMAGVDLAIDRGIADPDRLFVTGCSGGGVLTTWVIGQTDRFKAAAALCPVVNWIGMSGTTDVVGWLYNFFPKPFWEDPKPWLDHSTIMHVGSVKTPTLLMTGDKDLRTPLGEAEEYFAALKIRGVPTKLVPMRNEFHGTRSIPSNYLRTSLMLRKWFDAFDPAKMPDHDDAGAANETSADALPGTISGDDAAP